MQSTKQLDFSQTPVIHPIYGVIRLNQSDINTVSQGSKTSFEIPTTNVYNLSRSNLTFTVEPTNQDDPLYNVLMINGVTPINRISLIDQQNVLIAEVRDVHKYSNMTFRLNNKIEDVLKWDTVIHQGLIPPPKTSLTYIYDGTFNDYNNIADIVDPGILGADDPPTQDQVNDALIQIGLNINGHLRALYAQFERDFGGNILLPNYYYLASTYEVNDPVTVADFNTAMNTIITDLNAITLNIKDWLVNRKILDGEKVYTTSSTTTVAGNTINVVGGAGGTVTVPEIPGETLTVTIPADLIGTAFTPIAAADDARDTLEDAITAFIDKLNDPNKIDSLKSFVVSFHPLKFKIMSSLQHIRESLLDVRENESMREKSNELIYTKVSNDQGKNKTYSIDLNIFSDSLLGLDKDLFFGDNNRLRLVIEWNSPTKMFYISNNALMDKAVNITNIKLNLCIERNPKIIKEIKDTVYSEKGMTISTPFLSLDTNVKSTTILNHRSVIDKSKGSHLHKFYWSLYKTVTNGNDEYLRVVPTYFNTLINNVKTAEMDFYPANYDDYLFLKEKLKDSCIQSSSEYTHNHIFVQDLTEMVDTDIIDNSLVGFNLNAQLEYIINLSSTDNGTLYVYYVTRRDLNINNNTIKYV